MNCGHRGGGGVRRSTRRVAELAVVGIISSSFSTTTTNSHRLRGGGLTFERLLRRQLRQRLSPAHQAGVRNLRHALRPLNVWQKVVLGLVMVVVMGEVSPLRMRTEGQWRRSGLTRIMTGGGQLLF